MPSDDAEIIAAKLAQFQDYSDRFKLMQGELDRRFSEMSIGEKRVGTLKEYTDEGFAALRRSLDQFRSEFHDYIQSLHAEIDRRFLEARQETQTAATTQQRAIDAALVAAEKAVVTANVAAEKRFDGVNEFRGQLTDQAATFISRNEWAAAHQNLIDKMSAIDSRLGERVGSIDTRLTSVQGNAEGLAQAAIAAAAKTNVRILLSGLAISVVVVIVNVIIYLITHK